MKLCLLSQLLKNFSDSLTGKIKANANTVSGFDKHLPSLQLYHLTFANLTINCGAPLTM